MATPQILGPDGQPVRREILTQEHSAPTMGGVRSILAPHPAQGLTPQRLARLLRSAEEGDAEEYLALAEEMEEKDLHYLSVLGTRKRQVAQLEVTVEAASDSADDVANADLVKDFLERDCLAAELVDVLDAVGKGYSLVEIVWDMSERQWMPARLEWRDPRWFEIDRVDGRTLRLRGGASGMGGQPEDLPPFKYVRHFHKSKSGLPIRGGLARIAAWCYLFKNYTLKDWVAFAEIYGQPFRIGKYPPNATPEERRTLLRAVTSLGTDAAAIVPEGMLIEFLKTDQQGSVTLYKGLAEYLDAQLSKGVLGQTLTTEVKEGSFAAAKVHDEVRADIEASDARQLSAVLNRDLVRPLVDLNRGPQKAYPRLRIGRAEEVDVDSLTDNVVKLVPLGLRVSAKEMYDKIGLREPEADEEVLTPPAPRALPGLDPTVSEPAKPGAEKATAAQDAPPRDAADDLADRLDRVARGAVDAMIGELRALVEGAASLQDVADGLLERRPGMKPDALAELLRQALALAELMGRSDIVDGR
jgi:phage gp29-like protein